MNTNTFVILLRTTQSHHATWDRYELKRCNFSYMKYRATQYIYSNSPSRAPEIGARLKFVDLMIEVLLVVVSTYSVMQFLFWMSLGEGALSDYNHDNSRRSLCVFPWSMFNFIVREDHQFSSCSVQGCFVHNHVSLSTENTVHTFNHQPIRLELKIAINSFWIRAVVQCEILVQFWNNWST